MRFKVEKKRQNLRLTSCPVCKKDISVRGLRGHLAWSHGQKQIEKEEHDLGEIENNIEEINDEIEKEKIVEISGNNTQKTLIDSMKNFWFDEAKNE